MNRILLVFLCLLYCTISNLVAQSQSDLSWEFMMFQDDVDVDEVVKKFNAEWDGKEYKKGAGIKPFRRWQQLNSSRTNDQGKLNRAEHVQTFRTWMKSYETPQNHNRSLTCPVSPTGNWTSKGPNRAVENYGIGRINALAFHPTDPDQIWAASPSGGMWITYNYGESWSTFTDDFATLGFSDIVFNPDNPNTMYAATGDKDSGDAPSIGVMKTTDGGLTWSVVFSTSSRIHRLLINPNDTSILLAATSSGLYRTTNAGGSWTNELDEYIRHMEFKPGNPSIVYASEYTSNARFFRSTNAGNSWSTISLPDPSPAADPGRLAIGVSSANSNVVYLSGGASDPSNSNDFTALYKSTNSGASFSIEPGVPTLGSQYWYDWTIAVSPNDEDIIFTGGLGLDKSSNGGFSWSNNGSGVHVDHHYAGYHPITGDLFVGSDGGVYYSENEGVTWNFVNKGMSVAQYYRISTSDTEGDLVISGAQDNGTHLLKDGFWDRVLGGDGMECIINYDNPDIMYAETQYGRIRRSTNKGATFSTIFTPSDVSESGGWVTPYVMHPNNPDILYVGFESVHKSTDGGSNFSNSSGDLGVILNILAISDQNSQYVYAGSGFSLWRTTDGGASWNSRTSPSGFTRYITVDPKNRNILYAASSNSVYKSTNGGDSWTDISGTLPFIPINCVEMQEGPNNPLYAGTDFGVYYIDDSLADWILFSTGLPNVMISELEIDECQGMIRAASYGRGVWESPLYCTDVGTTCCSNLQPQLLPAAGIAECASSVELSGVPGPNNYDIKWYKNGVEISGATDYSFVATTSGQYSYQLVDPSNSSCNSLMSKIIDVSLVCVVDSTCSTLNPNTDNGPGNMTQLNLTGTFGDIASDASAVICITVDGDFANPGNENMTILDESGNDRGQTRNIGDCSGRSDEACFTITAADFNVWNNNNSIIVNLNPISTAINPNLCTVNEACMRLFLPAPNPCPPNDNLYVGGIIASDTYKAAININSDGDVNSGSDVTFESGDNVDLNQNFEVESNAEFEAKVTPCVGSSSRAGSSSGEPIYPLQFVKQAKMKY